MKKNDNNAVIGVINKMNNLVKTSSLITLNDFKKLGKFVNSTTNIFKMKGLKDKFSDIFKKKT